MEGTQWLASAAVPAAIAALACWLSSRLPGRRDELARRRDELSGRRDTVGDSGWAAAPLVVSLGWALAVTAGLWGQRWVAAEESSYWWPEDFWQRAYWAVLASAAVLGASSWCSCAATAGRWVLAGLLALGTAFISLPAGEAWEDTLPLHRGWMVLLGASCLLGFWSLDALARRGTGRWFPLVVLASLAGPLMVTVTTYGALAQWTVAALAATLVCVAFALAGRLSGGIGIAYPSAALVTVLTAAGRFYSYEELPWWSYLGALGIAPAVAGVDRLVASRPTALRVAVAAAVAVLMIAASAFWHLADLVATDA